MLKRSTFTQELMSLSDLKNGLPEYYFTNLVQSDPGANVLGSRDFLLPIIFPIYQRNHWLLLSRKYSLMTLCSRYQPAHYILQSIPTLPSDNETVVRWLIVSSNPRSHDLSQIIICPWKDRTNASGIMMSMYCILNNTSGGTLHKHMKDDHD